MHRAKRTVAGALFLAVTAAVAAEPLPFVDRYPVARLFAPPVATSADFSAGTRPFSFNVDWAQSATVSTLPPERLIFDAESVTLTGRWQWAINGWRLGLDVPVNYQSGGVLDRVIDEFHQIFGLPEGDRPELPIDALQFSYRDQRGTRFDVRGDDWGLGEVHVHVGRALTQKPDRFSAWRAHVKLPTGSTRRLLGSGTLGAGLEWHGRRDVLWGSRNASWYGGLGAQWHDGSDVLADLVEDVAVFGHGGLKLGLWPTIDGLVQVDYRSPYVDSELDGLGTAFALSVGLRWRRAGGQVFEFTVVEDIVPRSVPDVIFQLRWLSSPRQGPATARL